MALSNFYLTDRGNALMAQTLTGTKITITRAQIGEGTWPDGTTFANVAALVAPLKDLAIARKRADSNGQTIITVQFSTDGIGRAFNWSEFALWAADPTSPDDRTKDFILGTSRALAAEEAVHFDAVKEEFNFNVILKTTNADTVEIIFEGSTVYPALDPDGGLTLEGGLQIAGGQGAFVADAQSTIVEHRKDGDRFGFVVYPDMPIEERYKVFDEVDGVIRQYEILHTGIENLPETIGAEKVMGVVNEDDLFVWVDKQTTGGSFLIAPDRTTTNIPTASASWFIGHLDYNVSGKRITMTELNTLRTWVNVTRENIFTGWFELANAKDFLPITGGTLNGELVFKKFENGHTSVFKNHSAIADYGTTFVDVSQNGDDIGFLMNAAEKKAQVQITEGGVSKWYSIYHTGNAPAVIATAELV